MEFDNELIAEDVLANISRWILALYSSDVALILQQWNNELIKLDVLPYLVNLTIDLRTQNQTILDQFNVSKLLFLKITYHDAEFFQQT
jgi:hypothetical protein